MANAAEIIGETRTGRKNDTEYNRTHEQRRLCEA